VERNLVPTLVLHGPTWYATSNMKYSPLVVERLMPLYVERQRLLRGLRFSQQMV